MTEVNQYLLNDLAADIVDNVAFAATSTAYDEPDKDSSLEHELQRVAVTPTRTNSEVTVDVTFPGAAGATLSTTIASVTSTTVFTLNDVTGIAVGGGQRCQVTFLNENNFIDQRKISSLSGSQITLTEPLSFTPQVGDTFELVISRINLIIGTSSTLNSGNPAAIIPYFDTKANNEQISASIVFQVK